MTASRYKSARTNFEAAVEKIAYRTFAGKGRGVFARAPIAEGEIVERSPVLPIALGDSECPGLDDYALAWGEDVPGFDTGKECAIGLGYLSLYNHSAAPNVGLVRHYAENEISVRALCDIAAGEELSFDYGVPLWFAETAS